MAPSSLTFNVIINYEESVSWDVVESPIEYSC